MTASSRKGLRSLIWKVACIIVALPVRAATAFWRWFFFSTGSPTCLALIRMGLVANSWARWSNDHVLYRNLDPESLLVAFLFFVSSTMTFFGVFTVVAKWIFAATTVHFVYVAGHMYGVEPYTHHHTTLMALANVLLAFSPCGKALSVDRKVRVWWAQRKHQSIPRIKPVNLWTQRLIAMQVSSVYFWGAYDKINPGFLSGARMSHYLMHYYTGPTHLSDISPLLHESMMPLSILVVALEFALSVGLFFRRTRRWLIVPGLILHGAFYFSLCVFTYTTTMWVLYLAFLKPDDVDRMIVQLLPINEG